ncbi:[protein-PII] uridylyltransferase [Idiomarina xiamenensis]|uniref:Bifunctional uridylyltransferase/uridylyl-removing enzyme n=1 Tax=Idiomarina xiamenensis 10-D-4 TaxID=740709 RepID=K2KAJ3_9GAMM|nr:UTP:GlnB (protein PII) uridylyltransferase [Idiomarina xiamenensis 10-D-4]
MLADSSLFQPRWPAALDEHAVNAYREQIQAYNDWAEAQFVTDDIDHLVHHRAAFFDQLLCHLWQQFKLDQAPLALLAVGGFGRQTLHPGSDIDLLVTYQQRPTPVLEQQISRFITLLWDLRIDIGHAVRSIDDCMLQAAADITIATNLIENRLICGEQQLAETLQQRINYDFPWQSRDFYQAKCEEQQQRHQQYHGTSYNLEPNIKSSPGGLRDVQTIGWIAKQHFKTKTDESLVEYRYISAEEFLELRDCQNFLWRIRYALHLEVGKCEDRLLFDFQPGVASRLGYGNEGKHSVELMMKDYFKTVLQVSELNRMLLQFFEQAILGGHDLADAEEIDADFAILSEQIMARHDQVFAQPQNLLRFFLLIAEHRQIKGIHSHTIRLLRNARAELNDPLSHDSECRQLFKQLLRHPRGCGLPFALMHHHSILAHYLPQWRQIVGQMQFDLFHAYTVDEHTFRLVRNLYRYSEAKYAAEFPLCAELLHRMAKPELLYIAGIFHDIAKGRGGDHSELGEMDVRNFCYQHDYSDGDTELVAFLVRQHLLMSVTAQKRDIHDPDVIREFARKMGSQQRLDYLYCLTVADIRATNSTLWNNWKATLLEELYHATSTLLSQSSDGDEQPTYDVRTRINEHKATAMALLLSAGFEQQQVNALWGRFTADYFYRHSAEQVAWHSQHILNISGEHLPLILIGDENKQGTTELFIYHHEESHLFAAVAAVLDSQRLSIHDAQILATRDGYVMDTFVVLQHDGKPLTDSQRIEELKQHLFDVLLKRRNVPVNQRRLSRRMRNFSVKTRVKFLTSRHQGRTAFELVTLDRPGLVAKLAAVLQQSDVTLLAAKITTIGEQAEDLFIVTSAQQRALTDEQQQHLQAQIIAALDH